MVKTLQIKGNSKQLNIDLALRQLTGIEDKVKIEVYGKKLIITAYEEMEENKNERV